MSRFSKQDVFCNACGTPFKTTFHIWEGKACSNECGQILIRKKYFSILGQEYYPDPKIKEQERNDKTKKI